MLELWPMAKVPNIDYEKFAQADNFFNKEHHLDMAWDFDFDKFFKKGLISNQNVEYFENEVIFCSINGM